jgi:hypothetical protein
MNDGINKQENKTKDNIMNHNITKKLAGKVALVTGGSRGIGGKAGVSFTLAVPTASACHSSAGRSMRLRKAQ